jgi:hypothetical protein
MASFGFKAWPEVAAHPLAFCGSVWSCHEHRAELNARWLAGHGQAGVRRGAATGAAGSAGSDGEASVGAEAVQGSFFGGK